jgi:putative PIN family toxin of toxin-antitoxin system
VVDTNIFVPSFFGGNPKRIVDLWKTGEIRICLSPGIVDEYVDVLHRLGLGDSSELKELLNLFSKGYHAVFTHNTPKLSIVAEDPDDDKFIECAVALNSKYIISGDKALLAVGSYIDIKILPPRAFLEIFDKK